MTTNSVSPHGRQNICIFTYLHINQVHINIAMKLILNTRIIRWNVSVVVTTMPTAIRYIYKFLQKAYQFINVVNGVSHSHKTANIFFSFDSVA